MIGNLWEERAAPLQTDEDISIVYANVDVFSALVVAYNAISDRSLTSRMNLETAVDTFIKHVRGMN